MDSLNRIKIPVVITFGCSVVDAVLTWMGYNRGILSEVNPLWVNMLENEPMSFFTYKIGMTAINCLVLLIMSSFHFRMCLFGARFTALIYIMVVMYHIIGVIITAV